MGAKRKMHEIHSRSSWQELFRPLWLALDPNYSGHPGAFDNEVFAVNPFDWDMECDCGYEDIVNSWWEQDSHTPTCFHIRLRDLYFGEWDRQGISYDAKQDKLREFLRAEGAPHEGCMVRCDCGADERANAYFADKDHDINCRLCIPNFWYKPTNYQIEWYKHPFRSARHNQKLTIQQVAEIVGHCLRSLREAPHAAPPLA